MQIEVVFDELLLLFKLLPGAALALVRWQIQALELKAQ